VSECIESSKSDSNKPRTWYVKIHHIYAITLQRYPYILKFWIFYTTLSVHKIDRFGFMRYYFALLPVDDPLWPASRSSIKCYIVMSICMELVCVFCLLSVVNPLSIIHGMNNTKFTLVMFVRPSVCPHLSARLSLDGLPWHQYWALVWKCVQNIKSWLKCVTHRHKYVTRRIHKYMCFWPVTFNWHASTVF